MHIYEIKYSRGRTVQPRAYESDRIDVELTAQLVEGEDVGVAVAKLRELVATEVGRSAGKTTEKVTKTSAKGTEPTTADATDPTAVAEKTAKKTTKKAAKTAPVEAVEADERGATGDIQDEELVAEAAKAAKTITPAGVKDIMAEFKVPRLSKIAQAGRADFISALHGAVEAKKKADTASEDEIPL